MEDQEMERECNEDNFLDKNNLEQFKKKNYDMSVQLIKIKKRRRSGCLTPSGTASIRRWQTQRLRFNRTSTRSERIKLTQLVS